MRKSAHYSAVIILVTVISAGACVASGEDTTDAVAWVNDDVISEAQLENRFKQARAALQTGTSVITEKMEDDLRDAILNEMISELLLEQEATRRQIEVTDSQMQRGYEKLLAQYENEEHLQEHLQKENMSFEMLQNMLKQQIKIRKLITEEMDKKFGEDEIDICETQLKESYDAYAARLKDPPEFEEIRPIFEQQFIEAQYQDVVDDLIEQLKEEASIKILLDK